MARTARHQMVVEGVTRRQPFGRGRDSGLSEVLRLFGGFLNLRECHHSLTLVRCPQFRGYLCRVIHQWWTVPCQHSLGSRLLVLLQVYAWQTICARHAFTHYKTWRGHFLQFGKQSRKQAHCVASHRENTHTHVRLVSKTPATVATTSLERAFQALPNPRFCCQCFFTGNSDNQSTQ
jgi:hypothetical protein